MQRISCLSSCVIDQENSKLCGRTFMSLIMSWINTTISIQNTTSRCSIRISVHPYGCWTKSRITKLFLKMLRFVKELHILGPEFSGRAQRGRRFRDSYQFLFFLLILCYVLTLKPICWHEFKMILHHFVSSSSKTILRNAKYMFFT